MQLSSKFMKLLGVLCVALTGAVTTQAQFSGNYQLQNEASGLSMNVSGASTSDGAAIIQWGYSGTANELWTFKATSSGYYQINNVRSGKDAVVQGASTSNGAKIIQWTFGSSGDDQWKPVQNSDGSYTFYNLHSGKVIDDPGSSTSAGTQFDQWSANGGANQKFKVISQGGGGGGGGSGFGAIVSQAQFNKMFPNANSFYTYNNLVAACSKYPGFCTSGNATQNAQEAAAFLANVAHETGGLVYVNEIQQAPYTSGSTACGSDPSGQEYYGRGPLQLSWDFNYCACGQAIGQNLFGNPNLVSSNGTITWQTALWYWMTQTGGYYETAHQAILNGSFGGTIEAINGSIECNGGNPAEVQDRLNYYLEFLQILGVSAGSTATGC